MTNLSYSGINLYKECSQKYYFARVLKIPQPTFGSALHFGSAMDEAFNAIFTAKKDNLPSVDGIDAFNSAFASFRGECPYSSLKVGYTYADFDGFLLTDKQIDSIQSYSESKGVSLQSRSDIEEFCEEIKILKYKVSVPTLQVFNYCCYLTLRERAKVLLSCYIQEVLPKIHTVFEVQKRLELRNEEGDVIYGVLDGVVSFIDNPTLKYVIDHKTTSVPYKPNSANESEQLALYAEHEGLTHVAFIVLGKKVRKRTRDVSTDIILGVISEEFAEKTFDATIKVLYDLREGKFVMKDDKKECWSYGRRCEYFDRCWGNGEK